MKKLRAPKPKAKKKPSPGQFTAMGGDVSMFAGAAGNGCGIWINLINDALKGIAIYQIEGQMAIGLRNGASELAVGLSVDEGGEGYLQLRTAAGEVRTISATELFALLDAHKAQTKVRRRAPSGCCGR